eukprot:PhF_6_TR3395/c0_g3_i1/m.4863
MMSLILAAATSEPREAQGYIQHLPHDCVSHITSFCPSSTKLAAYLVCRSWYHGVERYVCLADTFYYLPKTLDFLNKLAGGNRRTFFRGSLSTIQEDARYELIEVMYIECGCDGGALSSQLSLCKKLSIVNVLGYGRDSELPPKKMNIARRSLTDNSIRGLETIPTLKELDLSYTNITDVSFLSACKAMRKLNVTNCSHLTDLGIRGLESIPTLEELDLSYTKITDVSRLRGCLALQKLNVSKCPFFDRCWCSRFGDHPNIGRT